MDETQQQPKGSVQPVDYAIAFIVVAIIVWMFVTNETNNTLDSPDPIRIDDSAADVPSGNDATDGASTGRSSD